MRLIVVVRVKKSFKLNDFRRKDKEYQVWVGYLLSVTLKLFGLIPNATRNSTISRWSDEFRLQIPECLVVTFSPPTVKSSTFLYFARSRLRFSNR